MKLKILAILIILSVLGVGGFFVYKNMTGLKVERGVVPAPATQVRVYKGIWTPTILIQDVNYIDSNAQKLKGLGINTIFIMASAPQSEEWLEKAREVLPPKLIKKVEKLIPREKEIITKSIQDAHRNGLKIALTIVNWNPPLGLDLDIELVNSKIIEYAILAEKYEVEFFAPMGEPEAVFGPSASATWGQEILPKIKEVYHGEVIWKGGSIGDIQPDPGQPNPTNFSGYDYIGFTISVGSDTRTLEEFSQGVDYALDTILKFAERDNCKGVMITEFYGRLPERWERKAWSEEKDARAHEIVLEKGSAYDKVFGFFANSGFLGVDVPGIPGGAIEENKKTTEVIRKYFTEILK